jgi:hypothetical protein
MKKKLKVLKVEELEELIHGANLDNKHFSAYTIHDPACRCLPVGGVN